MSLLDLMTYNQENVIPQVCLETLKETCWEFQESGGLQRAGNTSACIPMLSPVWEHDGCSIHICQMFQWINKWSNNAQVIQTRKDRQMDKEPWCFSLKLKKGMIWIGNKKNEICDRYLYLSLCFGGLKQFSNKHNKWEECCLCKWDTKKKKWLETNYSCVPETKALPYKGPRLKTQPC